jgi:hypothetical protein
MNLERGLYEAFKKRVVMWRQHRKAARSAHKPDVAVSYCFAIPPPPIADSIGREGGGAFCAMFVTFARGEFMSKQTIVTLADGRVVVCAVVEHSYRHDADARAAWCSHDGREFVAVRRGGL